MGTGPRKGFQEAPRKTYHYDRNGDKVFSAYPELDPKDDATQQEENIAMENKQRAEQAVAFPEACAPELIVETDHPRPAPAVPGASHQAPAITPIPVLMHSIAPNRPHNVQDRMRDANIEEEVIETGPSRNHTFGYVRKNHYDYFSRVLNHRKNTITNAQLIRLQEWSNNLDRAEEQARRNSAFLQQSAQVEREVHEAATQMVNAAQQTTASAGTSSALGSTIFSRERLFSEKRQ